MTNLESTGSLWMNETARARFPALGTEPVNVDVIVVGGGITGVTTALLLKEAGQRVALLEAAQVGAGVTSGTTAHLTEALDTRFHEVESKFGREGASLCAESGRLAIEQIASLVESYSIDCEFERLPGYLFATDPEQREELERERAACERIGLRVESATPDLPLPVVAALRFENQGQFHPVAYVSALARTIPGNGSHLYEGTRVIAVEDGEPCRVYTGDGSVLSAPRVVLATHSPLNRVLLQTKIAAYRSYVISGPVKAAPQGLYWDLADPYHYIRRARVGDAVHLVVGGEDHKTGKDPEPGAFERLLSFAEPFGLTEATRRWSAQVVEPADGLPFIGRNAASEHVYVATGFSGNGMTFGTLAAIILTDACVGKKSRFADLYEATRVKPVASLPAYLLENVDFPLHLITDPLRPVDALSVEDIQPGKGAITRVKGERLAVYRDSSGGLTAVSPICTHLGCHVKFNETEKSWDCPCHGSRFRVDGTVIDGPAVLALRRRALG
ncbi:MAG TPA: FAD-dependent oxidoreductase [Polyangiaceae bacterium]